MSGSNSVFRSSEEISQAEEAEAFNIQTIQNAAYNQEGYDDHEINVDEEGDEDDEDSDSDEYQKILRGAIQSEDMIGTDLAKIATQQHPRPDEEELQQQQQQQQQQQARPESAFRRRASTIINAPALQQIKEFSFWDTDFKRERIKIYLTFLWNYVILSIIFCVILSIYWGSFYRREKRFVNLHVLIVVDEIGNSEYSNPEIEPLVSQAMVSASSMESVKSLAGWQIYNHTRFEPLANKNNNTMIQEVYRQIHHQFFWAGIYVKPNATEIILDAIINNNTNFTTSETLVDLVYETGRDIFTMSQYVVPFLAEFEKEFINVLIQQYPKIITKLDDQAAEDGIKLNALNILSNPPTFNITDRVPITSPVITAPMQLGSVYLVLFAFFQFLMTISIQSFIATKVKGFKYILVRLSLSQVAYLIISLANVLLNIAFQIDHTATFGKSGALVLWSIGYLTMASLGGINEIFALICFTYYPPMIGGWLVFLMCTNVAPTVSSMALTNHFYRYGYAMPIHNSVDATAVVFFDIYKGKLRRNFGILCAWVIVSNLALPFVLKHVSKVKTKKEAALAAKALKTTN